MSEDLLGVDRRPIGENWQQVGRTGTVSVVLLGWSRHRGGRPAETVDCTFWGRESSVWVEAAASSGTTRSTLRADPVAEKGRTMNGRTCHWRDEWNDLPGGMRDFATHAGPTDTRILLLGEPGSGKGYLARILHDLSSRAHGPFVPQNCGVFTDSLAEAKLFGNVRGAYTGATDSRAGLVEAAVGGTLFLDELGALPPAVQPMLLTFLETGEFRRMGSNSVLKADVRVIAATNRDLSAAIGKGAFREDLVARFSPRYKVPPLRERRREIEGIIQRFLRRAGEDTGVEWSLTETASARLRNHDWPRNIRELLNALGYCRLFAQDGFIHRELVEKALENQRIGMERSRSGGMGGNAVSKPQSDREQREELAEALEATGGDKSKAARLLGINRRTVYRRLKRLGGHEALK